jgi:hypothetical protein
MINSEKPKASRGAEPPVYSSGFEPDPNDALDVLAFVLCPATVFAPTGSAAERAAIAEMLGPAKEEAIRRWQEASRERAAN